MAADFRPGSKAALFLELAKPNKHGFSRAVPIAEFKNKYQELQLGNGGSWCRDDGPLARKFNIERGKEGGRISYVRLHGYKKAPITKPIPLTIRKEIEVLPCVVLGTSDVEVDHKDGRRDDPRLNDASKVTLDDFQPLSKAANSAKRLGYPVSQMQVPGSIAVPVWAASDMTPSPSGERLTHSPPPLGPNHPVSGSSWSQPPPPAGR